MTEKRRVYYLAHREEQIARATVWARENRDRRRQIQRRYRERHRERLKKEAREAARRRWTRDPERGRRRLREYRAKNREKVAAWNINMRRARLDTRVNSVAVEARFDYYGWRCAYCGSSKDLQADHIKPKARGGADLPCNLVPACGPCNRKKHARWAGPHDWMQCRDYRLRRGPITPARAPSPE